MRVLLDECVPRKLKNLLIGHDVKTVPEMGWASIKNGRLLSLAGSSFDVFVTVDRNLEHQQNLAAYQLGIVVLVAKSNQFRELRPLAPDLLQALTSIKAGDTIHIAASR